MRLVWYAISVVPDRQCVAAGQHNEHIGVLDKNTIGYKVFDESFGKRTSERQAIFTRASVVYIV